VNHDKIVSLEERLKYLITRYAKGQKLLIDAIKMNFEICRKVEKKLFSELDFPPESLPRLARSEMIGADT
jgi:hypothetical protein